MGDQYLAEVRIFANKFAPVQWTYCEGQLIPIDQNQALFSLLWNNFGGNARTNFGIPDLKGRATVHFGTNHYSGINRDFAIPFGKDSVQLTTQQIPNHTHEVYAIVEDPKEYKPDSAAFYASAKYNGTNSNAYTKPTDPPQNLTPFAEQAMAYTGGSEPHENRQPYLGLNYCIAFEGLYPPRD